LLPTAVTVTLLLALTPARPGGAQTVQGAVLDAASGVPINLTHVALVATDDSIVGRYVSDRSGRFLIGVPEAGRYRLRATRMGYSSFTTDFVLVPGQDAIVEIRLQPTSIPLDPIEAVAERPVRRLARVGFYDRQAKGFGHFRTAEELDALHPIFPEDLFWGVGGVRMLHDGTVVSSTFHGRCALSVAVDGLVVQQGGRGGSSAPWTEFVHVNDIEAIEVYPHPGGVPV